MSVLKLSVSLDEAVAKEAASAAEAAGVSLSSWLSAAAKRALIIERGPRDMAEWEAESGAPSAEAVAWADEQLARAGFGPLPQA